MIEYDHVDRISAFLLRLSHSAGKFIKEQRRPRRKSELSTWRLAERWDWRSIVTFCWSPANG